MLKLRLMGSFIVCPLTIESIGRNIKTYRKNKGFTQEERTNLKNAYKMLEACTMRHSEAADTLEEMYPNDKHVLRLAQFIRESKRGVCFEQHVHKVHENEEQI